MAGSPAASRPKEAPKQKPPSPTDLSVNEGSARSAADRRIVVAELDGAVHQKDTATRSVLVRPKEGQAQALVAERRGSLLDRRFGREDGCELEARVAKVRGENIK